MKQPLKEWLEQMTERIRLAFVTSERYPSIIQTYSELLDHPLSKDAEYLESVTSASILYPTLAHIAAILKDETVYATTSGIQTEFLAHSNFQLWFPDDASEENLYTDQDLHGIAFTDIKLQEGLVASLERIADECSQYPQFGNLSCVKNGWWPLVRWYLSLVGIFGYLFPHSCCRPTYKSKNHQVRHRSDLSESETAGRQNSGTKVLNRLKARLSQLVMTYSLLLRQPTLFLRLSPHPGCQMGRLQNHRNRWFTRNLYRRPLPNSCRG